MTCVSAALSSVVTENRNESDRSHADTANNVIVRISNLHIVRLEKRVTHLRMTRGSFILPRVQLSLRRHRDILAVLEHHEQFEGDQIELFRPQILPSHCRFHSLP